MREKKPNLFIIGAMKSGTTSLHQTLSQHRDIFMSSEKEPGFFVEELYWKNGQEWYLSLFDDAEDETYIGESSTHYTKLPNYQGVCVRIYNFNQNAKLIYIMRNPVDRAISHYWHNIHLSSLHIDPRYIPEKRNILVALRDEHDFINFSNYAMQLKPYIDTFGLSNIFITTFEKLVHNTSSVMKKLFGWLNLPLNNVENSLPAKNVRGNEITKIRGTGILHKLRHTKKLDYLSPYVPQKVKKILKRYSIEKIQIDEIELRKARAFLIERQKEQVQHLEVLLNRTFTEWKEFY